MASYLHSIRRVVFSTEASAVFFAAVAIYALAIGEAWFGAAWAWLSGAQFSLAAWLRHERREKHTSGEENRG